MKASVNANLSHLGVLQLAGVDSCSFLQGQISADARLLSPAQLQLAGYHSREGRVIALMRLVAPSDDLVLVLLPRELVAPVAERLRRFVLRAKTVMSDATADWRITGLIGPSQPEGAIAWPASFDRWIRIERSTEAADASSSDNGAAAFRARDIADGIPQVYAATSDSFVAQMLNLDALGAIAFDKGCYTGQEIIARAHYRGRVKRRVQRFRAQVPVGQLAPGTQGRLHDGRAFTVVDATGETPEVTQFLAVVPLEVDATFAESIGTPAAIDRLQVEWLPLPYSIDS